MKTRNIILVTAFALIASGVLIIAVDRHFKKEAQKEVRQHRINIERTIERFDREQPEDEIHSDNKGKIEYLETLHDAE